MTVSGGGGKNGTFGDPCKDKADCSESMPCSPCPTDKKCGKPYFGRCYHDSDCCTRNCDKARKACRKWGPGPGRFLYLPQVKGVIINKALMLQLTLLTRIPSTHRLDERRDCLGKTRSVYTTNIHYVSCDKSRICQKYCKIWFLI